MTLLSQNKHKKKFKSGFVAIIGAPNVGKSTLLNKIINKKISITSNKPQTTRNKIFGILTKKTSQLIFIDTPGVHNSSNFLNNRISNLAMSTITNADIVLFIIDISKKNSISYQNLFQNIKYKKKNIVLALNKIDKVKKTDILEIIKTWTDKYNIKNIIPISALRGYQVEKLTNVLEKFIPFSSPIFSEKKLTNLSQEFIISEIIREKIFRLTGQEIPYSVAVTIDKLNNKIDSSCLEIFSTIYVERISQKSILIGKNGKKISQISKNARLEIEKIFLIKVFIRLFIKVEKNWSKNIKAIKYFGY